MNKAKLKIHIHIQRWIWIWIWIIHIYRPALATVYPLVNILSINRGLLSILLSTTIDLRASHVRKDWLLNIMMNLGNGRVQSASNLMSQDPSLVHCKRQVEVLLSFPTSYTYIKYIAKWIQMMILMSSWIISTFKRMSTFKRVTFKRMRRSLMNRPS
jgi:hypothetical protein